MKGGVWGLVLRKQEQASVRRAVGCLRCGPSPPDRNIIVPFGGSMARFRYVINRQVYQHRGTKAVLGVCVPKNTLMLSVRTERSVMDILSVQSDSMCYYIER